MKLRDIIFVTLAALLLAACNMTLAQDVAPPPGYVQPTPQPTLGPLYPEEPPDVENGAVIYAEKCEPCHGEKPLRRASEREEDHHHGKKCEETFHGTARDSPVLRRP